MCIRDRYIDTGKFFREPFRWLYAILAILNLLFPIVLLVRAIESDLFRLGRGGVITVFIFIWIVVVFISWIGFQIWWNRRKKIYSVITAHDDFVAIPVFSNFIQTFGEWLGMLIGIGNPMLILIVAVFLKGDTSMLRLPLVGSGALINIVLHPIYGLSLIHI